MISTTTVLESIEWSNFRWHNAPDTNLPRVLLVGDSIVNGYGAKVQEQLKGVANADFWATSKCASDKDYLVELDYILHSRSYAAVHFNNGLHGWEIDEAIYAAHLERALGYLKGTCPVVIWRNSTPVTVRDDPATLDPVNNPRVLERNALGAAIARKLDLPIDDLYALVVGKTELSAGDGYHFTGEGQDIQAAHVAGMIRELLGLA